VIDLVLIPGTYRGPDEISPFGDRITPELRLHANGEADWRFHDGTWSSSGHWKIVKGFHLSVVAIWNNAAARARHDDVYEQYWHLISVDDEAIVVRSLKGKTEIWKRCGADTAAA
jgi:hypothetical protein